MTEQRLLSEVNFILFTKDSCGPCGLVKRYFNALKDDRTKLIQEVQLEDFSDEPIPEENLAIAKKNGVTATPVLIITDGDGTPWHYLGMRRARSLILMIWKLSAP